MVRILLNKNRNFSSGLGSNDHLDLCNDLNYCDGLVYNLNSKSLEPPGLDNGNSRSDSSGGDSRKNVKEVDERVLCLYNYLIKVFDTVF